MVTLVICLEMVSLVISLEMVSLDISLEMVRLVISLEMVSYGTTRIEMESSVFRLQMFTLCQSICVSSAGMDG